MKPELASKYHVSSIGLFVSVVRDDFTPTNDIDIIVDFSEPIGIAFIDLAELIEKRLNKTVDLVSKKGVKKNIFLKSKQKLFMSKRNPKLLIEDILESSNKILNYTNGMSFEDFANDSKTVDAVIRNFEIIGEAANRLPDDFKDLYPVIDWYIIRGFRNRIFHDYMGIDYSIVWEIRNNFLDNLNDSLSGIKF
jgi:uncharacterized protein with HEPN domain/predicted nucleotidyltransferase